MNLPSFSSITPAKWAGGLAAAAVLDAFVPAVGGGWQTLLALALAAVITSKMTGPLSIVAWLGLGLLFRPFIGQGLGPLVAVVSAPVTGVTTAGVGFIQQLVNTVTGAI